MKEIIYNDKLTIRLNSHDRLIIIELADKLKTSASLLIRTIVQEFIKTHDDRLNEIIESNQEDENTLNEIMELKTNKYAHN